MTATPPPDASPGPRPGPQPGQAPARPRRSRRKRLLIWFAVGVLVALIWSEVVLRYAVGLGDPPLYQLDPEIEYMLKPSQNVRRLGRTFSTNRSSMRSPEFAPTRTSSNEFRVLVVGDSIPNGGVRVDQKELATELLRERLKTDLKREVVVGNASAGSWGLPNEAAYLRRFGTFDADVIILVVNSGDATDVPTFTPLPAAQPTDAPLLALEEVVENYGPRALSRAGINWFTPAPPPEPPLADAQRRITAAARTIVDLAARSGARLAVVQHVTLGEFGGTLEPGHAWLRQLFTDLRVPIVDLAQDIPKDRASEAYLSDRLHLSPLGQAALAASLRRAVDAAAVPVQNEQK